MDNPQRLCLETGTGRVIKSQTRESSLLGPWSRVFRKADGVWLMGVSNSSVWSKVTGQLHRSLKLSWQRWCIWPVDVMVVDHDDGIIHHYLRLMVFQPWCWTHSLISFDTHANANTVHNNHPHSTDEETWVLRKGKWLSQGPRWRDRVTQDSGCIRPQAFPLSPSVALGVGGGQHSWGHYKWLVHD